MDKDTDAETTEETTTQRLVRLYRWLLVALEPSVHTALDPDRISADDAQMYITALVAQSKADWMADTAYLKGKLDGVELVRELLKNQGCSKCRAEDGR